MKTTLIILLLSIFCFTGFSPFAASTSKIGDTSDSSGTEDLSYSLHGWDARLVKKEKLNEAKFITDVVPGYPVNWITEHVSVQIQATCSGSTRIAVSANDTLSAEQKNR